MIININGSSGHQSDGPLHKVFAVYFFFDVKALRAFLPKCMNALVSTALDRISRQRRTLFAKVCQVHAAEAGNTFTSTMANEQFAKVKFCADGDGIRTEME